MQKRVREPYAPSILVVDDDAQIRKMFRKILESVGYFVNEARTGREAMWAVEDRFFDLVTLDLELPDADGFEVIRCIRAELPDIKMLVVSGFMPGSLVNPAQKPGAISAMNKLAAPKTLLHEVCKLLESR
ncbi:MAG: response regulator [Bryobacteraceae bacterium]